MPLYSIKETGRAFGYVPKPMDGAADTMPRKQTLRDALRTVGKVANACETFTSNRGATLRVGGTYNKVSAGGHLVLQPREVDLRILPGTVDAMTLHDAPIGDRKHATLLHQGVPVHRATFEVADGADLSDWHGHTELRTTSPRLRQADPDKSIETIWREMNDVHHFHSMLETRGVSRLEAFNAVPDDLACRVADDSARLILRSLADEQVPLMAFVGNDAVTQIFSGCIDKLVEMEPYGKLIVHGHTKDDLPAVLRLSEREVAETWRVRRFSADGPIESLEMFDRDGGLILQLFGEREEGKPQGGEWQTLLSGLSAYQIVEREH